MSFTSHLQATNLMVVGAKSPGWSSPEGTKRVNKELSRGKYETALSLVKQLKGKTWLPLCLRLCQIEFSKKNFQEHKAITSPSEEDWFAGCSGSLCNVSILWMSMRDNVASVTGELVLPNQFMKDDVDLSVCLSRLYIVQDTEQLLLCDTWRNGNRTYAFICFFGYSEGFYSDVVKLNNVLHNGEGSTEMEKAAHIRWAASNTVSLLRSYNEARVSLAKAMAKPNRWCLY
ncbi:hypothetical protein HID58_044851 [Brassica napus]|uniref:Uncharacterized protein n=1 Tax=Brassica napus TaxID=3708 RepID=A0ABQ7XFW8_BRANA|nr:hypothetical protein HID58_044851 [Brassica napus]